MKEWGNLRPCLWTRSQYIHKTELGQNSLYVKPTVFGGWQRAGISSSH